jgi:hypothetical protein
MLTLGKAKSSGPHCDGRSHFGNRKRILARIHPNQRETATAIVLATLGKNTDAADERPHPLPDQQFASSRSLSARECRSQKRGSGAYKTKVFLLTET